ncbi:MAG: DUF1003 domain-containing protein [Phormidesmis sp.]
MATAPNTNSPETNRSKTNHSQTGHSPAIFINGEKYPLPEPVIKNIEKVIGLQADQESHLPIHERVLVKVAQAFGRPQFLYCQIIFLAVWWTCSRLAEARLNAWNVPLLDLRGQAIDVASLLIATGVLVRQTRQDKISEQRSHLMLQINLLNEQKIAKVIGLIEELRTDSPDIENRYDWEADIMQKATDPQVVLDIIEENLEHFEEQGMLETESHVASAKPPKEQPEEVPDLPHS